MRCFALAQHWSQNSRFSQQPPRGWLRAAQHAILGAQHFSPQAFYFVAVFLFAGVWVSVVSCVISCDNDSKLYCSDGVQFVASRTGTGWEGCARFMHGCSRNIVDLPYTLASPTMPGRCMLGFHRPGRHCVHNETSRGVGLSCLSGVASSSILLAYPQVCCC